MSTVYRSVAATGAACHIGEGLNTYSHVHIDDVTRELFDTFEREAFRLETLDDYGGSGNTGAYGRFLAGDPPPEEYNAEWVAELRSHTGQGKRVYRVHILSRPLTPYLRFELGWGYRTNQTGGEEFFILDTTDKANPLAGVGTSSPTGPRSASSRSSPSGSSPSPWSPWSS